MTHWECVSKLLACTAHTQKTSDHDLAQALSQGLEVAHFLVDANHIWMRLLIFQVARFNNKMRCFFQMVLVLFLATHHSLDCSVGESFCAMWYKALMAFMLNNGGLRSARDDTDTWIRAQSLNMGNKLWPSVLHERCPAGPHWGCLLTEFNAGDPEGPDVHLPLVLTLIHGQDNFWSHPKWHTKKCMHKWGYITKNKNNNNNSN